MKKRSYPQMRSQDTGRDEDAFWRAELATLKRHLASPRGLTRTGNCGSGRPVMMAGKRKAAATTTVPAPAPEPEPDLTYHSPGRQGVVLRRNDYGYPIRQPLAEIVRDPIRRAVKVFPRNSTGR